MHLIQAIRGGVPLHTSESMCDLASLGGGGVGTVLTGVVIADAQPSHIRRTRVNFKRFLSVVGNAVHMYIQPCLKLEIDEKIPF